MYLERGGVTAKQVDAPEAVFLVAKEEKLGRTALPWIWTVVPCRHTSNQIFVVFNIEGQWQMLDNSRASASGI